MGHAPLSKYKLKLIYYLLDLGVYLQLIANHFAMKRMLNANTLKASWKELKKLKEEYEVLTISPKYTRMKKCAA